MKVLLWTTLVLCVSLAAAVQQAGAQTPLTGTGGVDERQGDQYGLVADHKTAAAEPNSRLTGYLVGPAAPAPRTGGGAVPVVAAAGPQAAAQPPSTTGAPSAASADLEGLFWQSVMNSTNPAELEAYLAQFPNGVFRALAEVRLAAPAAANPGPGDVFRDCGVCPEMVVLPDGRLALGRYEVTVGEYRAFAGATGGGNHGCMLVETERSWRDPGFPQTGRHPVVCVNWDDAQEYVSWLSRTTGAAYRLPTGEEWERAAAGSEPGCHLDDRGDNLARRTCVVGSHGSSAAGLSDMLGNVFEWTEDCWEGDCTRREYRGGGRFVPSNLLIPAGRVGDPSHYRRDWMGFRVARTLD